MDKLLEQLAEAADAGTDSHKVLLSPKEFLLRTSDEVERAGRYDRPLSVALIVIDGMANLLKDHGVQIAELAFDTVADQLTELLRKPDRTGRLGRGELGVLMPETTLSNASNVADRLAESVANVDEQVWPEDCPLTLSIGVAGLSPRARNPNAFLMAACFELRRSQSSGGNAVCIAPSDTVLMSVPRSGQIH